MTLADAIGELEANDPSPTTLNLERNNIGAAGAQALAALQLSLIR